MPVENVFPYTFVATVASTFQGSRTNGSLSDYLCTLQLLQRTLRKTLRFLDVLYSSSNPFRCERTKRRYTCFRFKSEMKYWSFKSTSLASKFICLSATARKMVTSCWILYVYLYKACAIAWRLRNCGSVTDGNQGVFALLNCPYRPWNEHCLLTVK
jgi:hypothetical protein